MEFGRIRVVAEQSIETHDNAWGTESTLTAIALCYPLLCWMRVPDVSNALDSDNMLAVNTDDRREARID